MPVSGGKNFQQAYNVQAGVDTETMVVVTEHVTKHTNDKLEVEPTLKALEQLPETLGKVEAMLSDSGYRSENNVKGCDASGITPYFPAERQRHHPPVEARFTQPPALAANADVVETMDHRLATIEGRAVYALRKSTVEPVFGIIKSVLGFRQFHLRGLDNASGEWTLITMAWNLKRLFNLKSVADRTVAAACLKTSDTRRERSIRNRRSISAAATARKSANNSRQRTWREFLRSMFIFCDFETFTAGLSPTDC